MKIIKIIKSVIIGFCAIFSMLLTMFSVFFACGFAFKYVRHGFNLTATYQPSFFGFKGNPLPVFEFDSSFFYVETILIGIVVLVVVSLVVVCSYRFGKELSEE